MKYFDTHTHTNYEPLSKELSSIITKLEELDMGINIVGCDLSSSILAIEQAQTHPLLYCSIGIHPNDAKNYLDIDSTINQLEKLYLANKEKVLCIGECGLDYYRTTNLKDQEYQKIMFKAQIQLAAKYNLPVMMHIRNAHDDAIKIIQDHLHLNLTWIVHCFTSNTNDVLKYNALGCYISISGVVTFKNSHDLREAVNLIPLDHLLTETDSPWLAPTPYRGQTNYPYYVLETNKFLSEYLDIPLEKLNDLLILNASKAFHNKW